MSIRDFIRDSVLLPRLKAAGCLVVYDAVGRYRTACHDLANVGIQVVDASESSIDSREAALKTLRAVGQVPTKGQTRLDGTLIYVPAKRPETDEQRQGDPYALFAACGAVFPHDDGDEYLSLCLRAKPDHATDIRRVFAETPAGPAFAVIDAIGGGVGWPQLRATLGVESSPEILAALLAPNAAQTEAMRAQEGWSQEARDFLRAALAMTVKTRAKTWSHLADELWRYVLFSEFAFDLPGALPAALSGVPHAPAEARPIVEGVCDQLRSSSKTNATYVKRAEDIEADLRLAELCAAIDDLGDRDTFPFEERTFLRDAIRGITNGDADATRRALVRHQGSVWLTKGESQAQWGLVRAAMSLVEACEDGDRQLAERCRTQNDLLDYYIESLREVDRLQREFEQAVGGFIDQHGLLSEVIGKARGRYRRLAEKVQGVFIKHADAVGWPPAGRLANAEVFDRFVAPRLKDRGRKVAYLMVDALRYELGLALEKKMAEDGPVELHAAYAQLPTITLVGMASLLPGAQTALTLGLEGEALVPRLAGAPVANVAQRMGELAKRWGDRFAEMRLGDFVRGKPKFADTVDLLVLRSTEIDSQLENNPETTLGLIPGTLQLIRVALHKLRGMGFRDAVLVTDHGFFLNAHAEAGDVCAKPQGAWAINAHDRMMLGDGLADVHSLVLSAEKVGIRGDFAQVAMPRSMAPYRSGHLYFHGGLSLAEAVVPVLVARLDSAEQVPVAQVTIQLSYKNGAKKITTRLPVIEVNVSSGDMFSQDTSVEVRLEAQKPNGDVVGEPRPGGDVNPATGTVTLMPGQRKQIALCMDPDYEGKFSIKVLNPTTMASYCVLNLETDYTV